MVVYCVSWVERPVSTLHLVMKDGQIYRNEIEGRLSPAAVSYSEMRFEGVIEHPAAPY